MTEKLVDLVQVIRDNPGCVARIDNDWWKLYRVDPSKNPNSDDDFAAYDQWEEDNTLAESEKIEPLGDGGYGSGNCYGGDLLQALAIIQGVKIESV